MRTLLVCILAALACTRAVCGVHCAARMYGEDEQARMRALVERWELPAWRNSTDTDLLESRLFTWNFSSQEIPSVFSDIPVVLHAAYDAHMNAVVLFGLNIPQKIPPSHVICAWGFHNGSAHTYSAVLELEHWAIACQLPKPYRCQTHDLAHAGRTDDTPGDHTSKPGKNPLHCNILLTAIISHLPVVIAADGRSFGVIAAGPPAPTTKLSLVSATRPLYVINSTALVPRISESILSGREAPSVNVSLVPLQVRGEQRHHMCIVGIMFNEEHYVREWIDYHSHTGVSFFLLFDNDSTDQTAARIKEMAHRGAQGMYWPFRGSQEVAYVYGNFLTRDICDITFYIDTDEFLAIPSTGNQSEMVDDVIWRHVNKRGVDTVSEISLRQITHGHPLKEKLLHRPTGSVIELYTDRAVGMYENWKSAMRNAGERHAHAVHYAFPRAGHIKVMIPDKELELAHYKTKSWEDQLRRHERRAYRMKWTQPATMSIEDPPPEMWAEKPGMWKPQIEDLGIRNYRDSLYAACAQLASPIAR